jgi:hypothetical protein
VCANYRSIRRWFFVITNKLTCEEAYLFALARDYIAKRSTSLAVHTDPLGGAFFIGRPVLWGLASFGEAGVSYVLEMVREEFDLAMALSGLPDIELNYTRSHLVKFQQRYQSSHRLVISGFTLGRVKGAAEYARRSIETVEGWCAGKYCGVRRIVRA